MASGTLGQSAPSAATNTTVYTVPSGKTATFNVNVCNRGYSDAILVRIAVCASSTPATSEYIEYDVPVDPNSAIERTGIVASAGKLVVVYASTADASFNVYGFEE